MGVLEAKKAYRDTKARLDRGELPLFASSTKTVSQVAHEYWDVCRGTWSPSEADRVRGMLDMHLLPFFGSKRIGQVRQLHEWADAPSAYPCRPGPPAFDPGGVERSCDEGASSGMECETRQHGLPAHRSASRPQGVSISRPPARLRELAVHARRPDPGRPEALGAPRPPDDRTLRSPGGSHPRGGRRRPSCAARGHR